MVRTLPLLIGLLACARPAASAPAAAAALPVPRVEPNACPFECCQLGRWIVHAPLRAFAAPLDTSRIAFRIAAGDTVAADSGLLAVDPVGRVVIRRAIHGLSPGDTVLALHGSGEGDYRLWWSGGPHDVEPFWPVVEPEESWAAPSAATDTSAVAGEMIAYPRVVWWVRVTRGDGARGWLRLRNRLIHGWYFGVPIDGMDGCG